MRKLANVKIKYFLIVPLLLIGAIIYFLNGLSHLGGGTHGSIKAYIYDVKKQTLQDAVEQIIFTNKNIIRDTIHYSVENIGEGKMDTIWDRDTYYNDTINYVTMYIKNSNVFNRYIFRYGGGKEDWDTSKSSSIFIAYAYDNEQNGGSEGNGGVKFWDFSLKKKLTQPFEKELVNKLDSLLRIKHTEE